MRDLVIDALAVHRITKLVIDDEITRPLRDKVLDRYEDKPRVAYFLSCPWCVSIWAAAGATAFRAVAPGTWNLVARSLAASSVVGLIEEHT